MRAATRCGRRDDPDGGEAHRNGGNEDEGVRPALRKMTTTTVLDDDLIAAARVSEGSTAWSAPPEGPRGFK